MKMLLLGLNGAVSSCSRAKGCDSQMLRWRYQQKEEVAQEAGSRQEAHEGDPPPPPPPALPETHAVNVMSCRVILIILIRSVTDSLSCSQLWHSLSIK